MAFQGNPSWTRDETLLAYDVLVREYLGDAPHVPDKGHEAVADLSELLRSLPVHPPEVRQESFRNLSGVARKLGNLLYVHTDGAAGSGHHSAMDEHVVKIFQGDSERLAAIADGIRDALARGDIPARPIDDEEAIEAEEGRLLYRRHAVRERDSRINRRKKDQVLAATGRLACEVCGFEFGERYGEHGRGFAEAHHTRPLSDGTRTTRLEDLAIVCSNCHRMLHRGMQPPTVAELAAKVKHSGYASK